MEKKRVIEFTNSQNIPSERLFLGQEVKETGQEVEIPIHNIIDFNGYEHREECPSVLGRVEIIRTTPDSSYQVKCAEENVCHQTWDTNGKNLY